MEIIQIDNLIEKKKSTEKHASDPNIWATNHTEAQR